MRVEFSNFATRTLGLAALALVIGLSPAHAQRAKPADDEPARYKQHLAREALIQDYLDAPGQDAFADDGGYRLGPSGTHFHEFDLGHGDLTVSLSRGDDLDAWAYKVFHVDPDGNLGVMKEAWTSEDGRSIHIPTHPGYDRAVLVVTAAGVVPDPFRAEHMEDPGGHYRLFTSQDLPAVADFDGNGYLEDIVVFSPHARLWFYDTDRDGWPDFIVGWWGLPGDLPVAGDFDRDGLGDVGVYRPSTGHWYFDLAHDGLDAHTDVDFATTWTEPEDLPFAGDFDHDGGWDIGTFRPSDGTWRIDLGSNGRLDYDFGPWGVAGDLPVVADFDADGFFDDLGVFRPSRRRWYYNYREAGFWPPVRFDTISDDNAGPWALPGDKPIAGDLGIDGVWGLFPDGWATDVGVFRASNQMWYFDLDHDATTDCRVRQR